MSALPDPKGKMTEAEYLAFERESAFKHEFVDGEVYMMTGASARHNRITFSINSVLGPQIRGKGCSGYSPDMRVRTPQTGTYAYPDVTIVCGDEQLAEDDKMVLLNPTVIFEVLSPSTESYDRSKKFEYYREIASLQEYILVSQDRAYIERFVRQDGESWVYITFNGLDATLELVSIDCRLPLAEIYEQVDFESVDAEDN